MAMKLKVLTKEMFLNRTPIKNLERIIYFVQKFDNIVPVLYAEPMGSEYLVTIRGQDYLDLVSRANICEKFYCAHCGSEQFTKWGLDRKMRQKYLCKKCKRIFT